MFQHLLALAFALLFSAINIKILAQDPSAQCGGMAGWSVFNGQCYKLFTAHVNFEQGKQLCEAMGARVVSIHSAEENNLVARLINEDYLLCTGKTEPVGDDSLRLYCSPKTQWLFRSYIIGLHRRHDGHGGYVSTWEDGTPATYGNMPQHRGPDAPIDYPWSQGQPSGSGDWNYANPAHEDCTQMWHPCGYWNDMVCKEAFLAGVVCQKAAIMG